MFLIASQSVPVGRTAVSNQGCQHEPSGHGSVAGSRSFAFMLVVCLCLWTASTRMALSETVEVDEPYDISLHELEASDRRVEHLLNRYRMDRGSLSRFYSVPQSVRRLDRLRRFRDVWLKVVKVLREDKSAEQLSTQVDELEQLILADFGRAQAQLDDFQRVAEFAPFADTIIELAEARQRVESIEPRRVARTVHDLIERIKKAESRLATLDRDADSWSSARSAVNALRKIHREWFAFYDGYDPLFSWWVKKPHESVDEALGAYLAAFDARAAGREPAGDARARDLVAGVESLQADVMPALIERFRRELRSALPRQARRNQRESGADEQGTRMLNGWLGALEDLTFDELTRSDQVDYLLLKNYIRDRLRRIKREREDATHTAAVPQSSDGLVGRPIGRERLIEALRTSMIPYSPEEIIHIGEQEYRWCAAELKRASREMGHGDDWKKAVEEVKQSHVQPGAQPGMIRDLAWEAIEYLEKHDLLSIPAVARETWRMQMMTPKRQLVNPFFTGGEVISVSFPTDTMDHEAKLQSMRGNNIHFSRATVHHELIPGHHLQQYMNARYRPYRKLFTTPFWGEGWALYWEMMLYDRGFAKTPEDRIGFLVWRSHRCARIIFSINFHLGRMTPQECVELLVARVGFERNNATAEVRRSIGEAYSPLYQAAYMLGGLQIRSLRSQLVEQGAMTEKAFHDAVLRENSIPIEMVRALLTSVELSPDYEPSWRFYDVSNN